MKKLLFLFAFLSLIAGNASAKKVTTEYRNALILAYSPVNSVYEDENIKLEIYNEQLWATNKTKKTIFIDLSQCFLVVNGSSFPMYSKPQDEKKASKAGVSSSIKDEYLTIAPATGSKTNETFICNMSLGVYGEYTTTESPSQDFSEYDKRMLTLVEELLDESINADPKGKNYVGTVSRHLTEDESISNLGASIAYAFNKKAEDWTNISISTWVCDAIFAPMYVEMPTELSKKDKKGFGIKETAPAEVHVRANSPFEFEEDKSPIIVCDWEGDYKKGKFNLYTTRIVKENKMNPFAKAFFATITVGMMTPLLNMPISETTIKSIVVFDGDNADWGKMKLVGNIKDTKQSK